MEWKYSWLFVRTAKPSSVLFPNHIPRISARGALVVQLHERNEPLSGISIEPIAERDGEFCEISPCLPAHFPYQYLRAFCSRDKLGCASHAQADCISWV